MVVDLYFDLAVGYRYFFCLKVWFFANRFKMENNMEIFKAKTIMTTDVAYIKEQSPIYKVVGILVEKNITCLSVVSAGITLGRIIRIEGI